MDDYEEHLIRKPLGAESINLFGSYNCDITSDERNEWGEYLRTTEEWRRYEELSVEINSHALYRADNPEESKVILEPLFREQQALKRQCYEIGKKWFEGLLERRREAREAKKQSA
jgi:hypothetical protein